MDLGLSDKVVVVTGASRGIGRAIAKVMHAEGATVVMIARGADALRDAAEAVGAERVAHGAFDVAIEAGANAAIDFALARFGRVDVLVNNVGGSTGTGPFDASTSEHWARTLDLNLNSAVWCSQRVLPSMIEKGGGVIVHITSICGLEYCTSAPYTAAKGALASLTKEMATDLAKHKVRVAAVAPGSTLFDGGSWDRRRTEKPEVFQRMLSHELPWGRFGTPEEIADVVAFVASPRASWIAGSSVVVDGGQMRGL
ncbi:MAG: SDR family oxidoreductase [Polyangiaceae bacterium]